MDYTASVQERVGLKRFKSGIEFKKNVLQLARSVQDRLLNALPSNYSKDHNTNLAELFLSVAKEFSRYQYSTSDVNEDRYHVSTRPEYLFQILGDTLFLGEKVVNDNLADTQYRDFLINVRNGYYGGSRKDNIEKSVSNILGIPVEIQEIYLQVRKETSFYTLKDTHRMFFNIFMDKLGASTYLVGLLLDDIRFFIDMIKPSHTLYNTRLIWTETLGSGGECTPKYNTTSMPYTVYGASKIDMVTYLAEKIYKDAVEDPQESWEEGTIQSIDYDKGVILLTDSRILVYNRYTELYRWDGTEYVSISPEILLVGDVLKYYATKDGDGSSEIIDDQWLYSGIIDDIDEDIKEIYLTDGSIVVYNDETYMYTRDSLGEYRIEDTNLMLGSEIALKATKYNDQFQFYQVPPEVEENFFKQFDDKLIERPIFQEYVKKDKEIPEGTEEGYDVVVKDGVATIVRIKSKFYKRDNAKAKKEKETQRYSLYIDDDYTAQFSVDDPLRTLTQEEAKNIFVLNYGYTGLNAPDVDYYIDVAKTGSFVEDGEDATVQTINDTTELCDRRASCNLMPFYEDTRKFYAWPDLQVTSGFFNTFYPFTPEELENDPGEYNVPAWYHLSSDPNTYTMPKLPMLSQQGGLATPSDLIVYIDGRIVEDAVVSVSPWEGIVTLNFLPPFNTQLRIDYYYSDRFPKPQNYLETVVSDLDDFQAQPNDLVGQFNIISENGVVRRLSWPYDVVNPALYGDSLDYQVNKFPILNRMGELALPSDITVSVGTKVVTGSAVIISRTEEGVDKGTVFEDTVSDLTLVESGDTVIFTVRNYLDNSLIYHVEEVDPINGTFKIPNLVPDLVSTFPYTIYKYVEVPDAVTAVRPLLGHIRVDFLPPLDSIIEFNYYYTHQQRNYLMLPDACADTSYGFTEYTSDTYYGSKSGYTMLVDQNPDNVDQPYWPFEELLKIGYRYRVFNLSNSSVLNSETLLLNDYQRNTVQASFKNNGSVLNEFNLMFSPEYLTDSDKDVILNDRYLNKDIEPATILNPGIPLFVESYTDDGHYRDLYHAVEKDTYDPDLEGGLDIGGSFNIINPDDSGIIDFNNVCEYGTNKKINLHSDLKMVEFSNCGYDANLTSIDEGGQVIPFKFAYIDQYYPNRELRLNDYLDYINQVPSEYKTGSIQVLNKSNFIKSIEKNFLAVRAGDILTVKDVPFEQWDSDTQQNIVVYRDLEYVIVNVLDFETAKFNFPFEGASGQYDYDLVRARTYAVDVYLSNLNREIVLNGDLGYTYGIPEDILKRLPGYGETGVNFKLYFPDPDPDPYPRNPDNPWISNPSVSYYDIEEYSVDGKTYLTNRTQGVTGIINTSQIIDAEGNSNGYTGVYTGITGPSGALDLGITGPVDYADLRSVADYDVYQIPSTETGIFISYSEAEYRVQWRNWDQDMIIVSLGDTGSPGILIEDPYNLTDDIGNGIKRSYWNVSSAQVENIYCHGTVFETSERVSSSVSAASYPLAVMVITQEQEDAILSSGDPVNDLPELRLGEAQYQLYKRIIREILHDDSIKITEIQQLVPIV